MLLYAATFTLCPFCILVEAGLFLMLRYDAVLPSDDLPLFAATTILPVLSHVIVEQPVKNKLVDDILVIIVFVQLPPEFVNLHIEP
jgi:hypothetical protein